jgi:hypothetical protein
MRQTVASALSAQFVNLQLWSEKSRCIPFNVEIIRTSQFWPLEMGRRIAQKVKMKLIATFAPLNLSQVVNVAQVVTFPTEHVSMLTFSVQVVSAFFSI